MLAKCDCVPFEAAMSNSHPLRPHTSVSEIDHVHLLSEQLGALVPGEEYSDVTFIVENKRFPAHRVILAARCHFFRALLYGGMKESQPQAEVPLGETRAEAFSMLLQYLYTGRASLSSAREEVLLDFLGLAHRYGLQPLEDSISEFLRTVLHTHNVCLVFDVASLYCLSGLSAACCAFMDRHAPEVLASEGFLTLSKTALLTVVKRDSFAASEKEIFQALCRWCRHNGDTEAQEVMSAVRLPLMSLTELLNVVRPSGLISPDDLLDAIKMRSESRDMDLNYRGMLIPEENIATMKHGAQVVKGELKSALLDGDTQNYDLDHGFSRHPIEEDGRSCIQVKLGQPSIINHVRILLWDRDSRSYSYYIEVSMDELDWVRVVDHSKYLCRSWQNLYFPARVCRYVRIVGTHNTVNKVFHLVAFECMFTHRPYTLEKGLLAVPTENVATITACASVIEGVSRSRNALLNGDTRNYDWDSGYTCHQLGSGAIVIQLAQPYAIGSLRLLLWDCDERSYSYYIELSTNQQQWTRVVDRTKVACRSWQTLTFERQPASFIRIVGTHNTANEVFHCVHFECPAQLDVEVKEGNPGQSSPDPSSAPQQSRPPRPPRSQTLPTSQPSSHQAPCSSSSSSSSQSHH
ncbi:BTB/POZ domain-containing protein 9 [Arapaima gigas]